MQILEYTLQAGHYSKLFGFYGTSDHESVQKVPKSEKLENLEYFYSQAFE